MSISSKALFISFSLGVITCTAVFAADKKEKNKIPMCPVPTSVSSSFSSSSSSSSSTFSSSSSPSLFNVSSSDGSFITPHIPKSASRKRKVADDAELVLPSSSSSTSSFSSSSPIRAASGVASPSSFSSSSVSNSEATLPDRAKRPRVQAVAPIYEDKGPYRPVLEVTIAGVPRIAFPVRSFEDTKTGRSDVVRYMAGGKDYAAYPLEVGLNRLKRLPGITDAIEEEPDWKGRGGGLRPPTVAEMIERYNGIKGDEWHALAQQALRDQVRPVWPDHTMVEVKAWMGLPVWAAGETRLYREGPNTVVATPAGSVADVMRVMGPDQFLTAGGRLMTLAARGEEVTPFIIPFASNIPFASGPLFSGSMFYQDAKKEYDRLHQEVDRKILEEVLTQANLDS